MTQSIRSKMILFIGAPTVMIYVAVMVWILMFSKSQAGRFHRQEMQDQAETAAARFDDYFSEAAQVAEMTAQFVTRVPDLNDEQIYGIARDSVLANPRVYGMALAFEPGMRKEADDLFCPYAYRSQGKVATMNIGREIYDWYENDKWQWWSLPKELGKGGWVEPYYDKGAGNVLMLTYSTPFQKEGKFYGVATVDIDLETLEQDIGKSIVGERDFYIISASGQYMYSPHTEEIMTTNVLEVLKDKGRQDLEGQVREMLAGQSGVVTIGGLFETERHMYSFAPISSTGWTFVTHMPESEALAVFRRHMKFVVSGFLGALVLMLAAIWIVSRKLTTPIEKLRGSVLRVADGDLDARVEGVFSNDEIGDLAKNFNRMTADLKGQVVKLASEEAQREKAEEENRAKSDFLSHMSHELRTPLNGILGYAQILQRSAGLPAAQRTSVDAIVNCGDHLLSLINDVLDLSKIEAGHLEVDRAPCDLHKLSQGVADIVGQRARHKGLDFDIEVSPEVPQGIISDAAKIRQILVNLLGNAVKFTSEGGVGLKISEQPKGMLRFDVVDSGIGMSQQEAEQIFDPFKQVEAGKAAGGTGLGLAISKNLAEMLGGQISVVSEVGKGSTFTVTILLEEAATEDLSKLETEDGWDQGLVKLAPGQKVTVLVADDREANRDILNQLLGSAGFEVLIAEDGDVAVELARENGVDIILMDVRMPRMNGIEAVRLIRQEDSLKGVKIIAVTASVFPEFREKAKDAGFDDFLGKPFRVGELMHILEKHLDVKFEKDESGSEVLDDGKNSASPGGGDYGGVPGEVVDKLDAALKIRNLTAIKGIAAILETESGQASLGAEILKLAAAFDFNGLAALVEKLR
jgi:signal transduction histidine kinase/ActR/RegA family two-component response regulator